MGWFSHKHGPAVSDVERQRLWTEKQRNKENLWATSHPGITGVNSLLSNGGKGTWLDPAGDPAENAAFGEQWGRMGHTRELAAVNGASVDSAGDPYAANFARTKARIASGSDMANAFGQFKLNQSQQRKQILAQLLGLQFGADQSAMDRNAARDAAKKAQAAGLWGSIGSIGGDIAGAYAGKN